LFGNDSDRENNGWPHPDPDNKPGFNCGSQSLSLGGFKVMKIKADESNDTYRRCKSFRMRFAPVLPRRKLF
ncbi:MAG: hypothetical protein ACK5JT_24110, partial [Hyphomicrobiaceae bacterium]